MPHVHRLFLSALLTLAVVSGCAHQSDVRSKITRLGATRYPPTDRDAELYFGSLQPERKYEQIALIEVIGGENSDDNELIARMRWRARGVGADAIVSIERDNRERDVEIPVLSHDDRRVFQAPVMRGVAVRYIEPPAAEPPAAEPPAAEPPAAEPPAAEPPAAEPPAQDSATTPPERDEDMAASPQ